MSVKQDRTGVRTATDLERKYNFGKTFAEILGLINDSRDKVDSVESELRGEITEQVTTLRRDTESIAMSAAKTVTETLEDEVQSVSDRVASLKLDSDGVIAEVTSIIQSDLRNIENSVSLKVDAEAVSVAIANSLKGDLSVESVETGTGYRFDADGLTIAKEGTEMANKIDNTGMFVTRSGSEVLTANKDGVNAMNLHAKTYLIIGSGDGRSRFEDYGINRTGCYWIGG